MNEIKKQALGRGLSALFGTTDAEENTAAERPSSTLPMADVLPSRHQPRHSFPEEELTELSLSIQAKGVLQPILVRIHPQEKDKYEIVAGERRWRAAQKAGLDRIPALVKSFSDAEALEVGLLENIQRQDLNPIEEAEGYRRLAEDFHHTQDSLSRILGKSRSHLANTLRLLTLPTRVQEYLIEGKLSAGHGRALIGAEDPAGLADLIVRRNLNVRQTEELAKQKLSLRNEGASLPPAETEKEVLRHHLSELLGTPIDLVLKGAGGKIIIPFQDPGELDQILQRLNRPATEVQSTVPQEPKKRDPFWIEAI